VPVRGEVRLSREEEVSIVMVPVSTPSTMPPSKQKTMHAGSALYIGDTWRRSHDQTHSCNRRGGQEGGRCKNTREIHALQLKLKLELKSKRFVSSQMWVALAMRRRFDWLSSV